MPSQQEMNDPNPYGMFLMFAVMALVTLAVIVAAIFGSARGAIRERRRSAPKRPDVPRDRYGRPLPRG